MPIEKYAPVGTVINLITDAWAAAIDYDYNDALTHNGVTYRCILPHTAAAITEPGIGASQATYWAVLLQGNAAIAATAITHLGAYTNGVSYTVNASMVTEAKSGYGTSWWLCKQSHTGATNKNPTGSSGSTYWYEVVGGGVNGVSSLTTALDALSESTATPVGGTDLILAKMGGAWSKVKPDNFAKKYVMHQAVAAAMVPDSDSGSSEATSYTTPTNAVCGKYVYFDDDAKRYAHFNYDLPESYSGGAIKAYMGMLSTGSTSNSYVMGIAARCVGDGESIDQAFGSAVEVTDTCQGAAYKLLISPVMDAITPAGTPAGGKQLQVRIYRDPTAGADNLADNIYLLWVRLYVPVDQHSEV